MVLTGSVNERDSATKSRLSLRSAKSGRSSERCIAESESGALGYARFSPDGERIVYSEITISVNPLRERWVLHIVHLDGSRSERVIDRGYEGSSACWSPDGRSLALVETEPCDADPWSISSFLGILDLEDNTYRRLHALKGVYRSISVPYWR